MIEIGTSCDASGPVTTDAGWWSPSRTSTRSSSCAWSVVTNEISAVSEYSIDCGVEGPHPLGVPEHVRGRPPLGRHAVVHRAVADVVPVEQAGQRRPRFVRRHQVDLRHHRGVARPELQALEGRERVLVGHRREAELGPLVPDVGRS